LLIVLLRSTFRGAANAAAFSGDHDHGVADGLKSGSSLAHTVLATRTKFTAKLSCASIRGICISTPGIMSV
jgi:hypothetical protein